MCITLDGGSSPSVLPIDYFLFFFIWLSLSVRENRESLLENTYNYIFQLFILSTSFHL